MFERQNEKFRLKELPKDKRHCVKSVYTVGLRSRYGCVHCAVMKNQWIGLFLEHKTIHLRKFVFFDISKENFNE